jgi:hypothetical protein
MLLLISFSSSIVEQIDGTGALKVIGEIKKEKFLF